MLMAAVLFVLAQGSSLDAEGSPDSPELPAACEEARTQNEINACAAGELGRVDAQLNAQWQETMARMRELDGDGSPAPDGQAGYVETVRAAQRAWLIYRDQHCLAESFLARAGSMQISVEHFCKAYMTQQRTFELSELTMSLSN